MLVFPLLILSAVAAADPSSWADWSFPTVQPLPGTSGGWELSIQGCVKPDDSEENCDFSQKFQNFTLDLNRCLTNVRGVLTPSQHGGFANDCLNCTTNVEPYNDRNVMTCQCQLDDENGKFINSSAWISPYENGFMGHDAEGAPTCFNVTADAIASSTAATSTAASSTMASTQTTNANGDSSTTLITSTTPADPSTTSVNANDGDVDPASHPAYIRSIS
ncbi:hypothetical protein F5Y16DRAFT_403660 [Xylariaceae sp. FL0255]|nr:hypothetical protein F5Y16DRAFT_403660 [Xylariaceae sp. FL0255]